MPMTCLTCTSSECQWIATDRAACEDHNAEPDRDAAPAEDFRELARNIVQASFTIAEKEDLVRRIVRLEEFRDSFTAAIVRHAEGRD